ncbi:MAG TPA: tripartite tricarboxylate transporter substrate binding protein [Ramlibacter sp.]|nr:tripartite tricarboxylate transporter substrate binding protein [Ramlibacter sp.]
MRNLISSCLGAVAGTLVCLLATAAVAENYPARPVTIVTTLPAGSTVDALARVFGQQLSARLKESVVVENKTGAGLIVGMQAVANAPADGHTLAFTPVTPLSIQIHRQKNVGYTLDSFVPLCQAFENVFFLAVSPKSEVKDVRALIARLKKEPGKFGYGHSGTGSAPHLMAEEFWRDLGVAATDVPYRGETAFLPDLLSGAVEAGMVTTAALQQHNFRPLVIFNTARSSAFPDVPTAAELGARVPPSGYGGVFVRKGTPVEVVTKLEAICREIVGSTTYQQKAEALQQNATYLDRAAFSARLAADHVSKGKLLPHLKLKD